MKTIDNRTEMLIKSIQNEIISGQLRPGQRLMSLREIADKNRVSRSVVNSAISALSTKGYLRVIPRHFILVNDFLSTGSLAILEDIFQSENTELKLKMIKDTLSCRMMVEMDSISRIVLDSKMDLMPIKTVLQKEKKWVKETPLSFTSIPAIDLEFHDSLIRMGGNMVTSMIYHTFQYLAVRMVSLFYQNPSVVPFVFEKHSLIYDALSRKDALTAQQHLRELLEHGEHQILHLL